MRYTRRIYFLTSLFLLAGVVGSTGVVIFVFTAL